MRKASLVLLLMIMFLAGTVVVAAQADDMGMNIKEKYEEEKEKYMEAREKFLESKKKYKDMRNQFTFNNAKRYLNGGCNVAEKWLERFRNFLERSKIDEEKKMELMAEIDDHMATIENYRLKIDESETPEELRNTAREMNQAWIEMRIRLRAMVGEVAAYRIENVIERAENVSVRLENKIAVMAGYGIDTSPFESLLEEYNEHLQNAREYLQASINLFESGDIAEGNKELRKSTNEIKKAFGVIREFMKEMQKVRAGNVFYGYESGEVWAYGNGTAEIRGSVVVNVRGNGTLIVSPAEAIVTVVGFGSSEEENGMAVFEGEGRAVVRGENITVSITGNNISLFAKGKGTLMLEGEGIYRVKKLPEEEMIQQEYNETTDVCFGVC
jgi:hypothetical protein